MILSFETNIDQVIKSIESRKSDINAKFKVFLERLAEIGIDVAQTRFYNAQYDGNNDVRVEQTPQWIDDHTLAITASGKAITFIEFGAGVHYTEQHPKANELGMMRGEYGHGLGKLDAWRYKGDPGTNGVVIQKGKHKGEILTHGNPPARAMYDAGKEMRENVTKIAMEVFRK